VKVWDRVRVVGAEWRPGHPSGVMFTGEQGTVQFVVGQYWVKVLLDKYPSTEYWFKREDVRQARVRQ